MVRLQQYYHSLVTGGELLRLNSTMVRLQLFQINLYFIVIYHQVSIPLWFDYNANFRILLKFIIMSLNSTMVRLQRPIVGAGSNSSGESQFHYGSITTKWKGG